MNEQAATQDPGDLPSGDILQQMGVTEQEMPLLEEYWANGMKLIHGAESRDAIIESLKNSSLSDVCISVIERLDQSSGADIPDIVRFVAGFALLNQIAIVGRAAGIGEFGEQELMQAIGEVIGDQVKKGVASGKYDPNELKQSADAAAQKMNIDLSAQPEQPVQQPGIIRQGA